MGLGFENPAMVSGADKKDVEPVAPTAIKETIITPKLDKKA